MRGAAGNPLAPLNERFTPSVDFAGLIVVDPSKRSVQFRGSTATFPAYEAYVEWDGSRKPLFQLMPLENTTVWDLPDFDTGINSRSFDTSTTFDPNSPAETLKEVIPRGVVHRSQVVASVLSLPDMAAADSVLLAGITDSCITQGQSRQQCDLVVGRAKQTLAQNTRTLADLGLSKTLDRSSLLNHRLAALSAVAELKGNRFLEDALEESTRWLVASDMKPELNADGFLKSTLQRVVAHVQSAPPASDLAVAINTAAFQATGVTPTSAPEVVAAHLERVTSDPAVHALASAVTSGRPMMWELRSMPT